MTCMLALTAMLCLRVSIHTFGCATSWQRRDPAGRTAPWSNARPDRCDARGHHRVPEKSETVHVRSTGSAAGLCGYAPARRAAARRLGCWRLAGTSRTASAFAGTPWRWRSMSTISTGKLRRPGGPRTPPRHRAHRSAVACGVRVPCRKRTECIAASRTAPASAGCRTLPCPGSSGRGRRRGQ
jgi:hypothetical protein